MILPVVRLDDDPLLGLDHGNQGIVDCRSFSLSRILDPGPRLVQFRLELADERLDFVRVGPVL